METYRTDWDARLRLVDSGFGSDPETRDASYQAFTLCLLGRELQRIADALELANDEEPSAFGGNS